MGDIQGAALAVKGSKTRVHVLIRPRPGDFVYSALEKQVKRRVSPVKRYIGLPRKKRNTQCISWEPHPCEGGPMRYGSVHY